MSLSKFGITNDRVGSSLKSEGQDVNGMLAAAGTFVKLTQIVPLLGTSRPALVRNFS